MTPATMPTDPTTIVRDSAGRELNCHLEQRIQVDGVDYALLTPVDVPVILAHVADDGSVCGVDDPRAAESILCAADAELQKYGITLIRSAGILTVRGEMGEADPEDMDWSESDEDDGEADDCEPLISFDASGQHYELCIPLDPCFLVARLHGETASLLDSEEFDRIHACVEQALGDQPQP
jgi:hypothetical protein